MKDDSISLSCAHVRAILAGTMTQVRFVVTPQPSFAQVHTWRGKTVRDCESRSWCWRGHDLGYGLWDFPDGEARYALASFCPYGRPGDRLWVRETFALSQRDPDAIEVSVAEPQWWDPPIYFADGDEGGEWSDRAGKPVPPPWCHAREMPRWASRITLELTAVRVELLQSVSEEDARKEGVLSGVFGNRMSAREVFAAEWNIRTRAPTHKWEANPWVWVMAFKRVE